MGSYQNVPPDDNNCPLTRVVHFEVPAIGVHLSAHRHNALFLLTLRPRLLTI